ncbi:unnamed protein product, partial [Choristocarpus tenellus]
PSAVPTTAPAIGVTIAPAVVATTAPMAETTSPVLVTLTPVEIITLSPVQATPAPGTTVPPIPTLPPVATLPPGIPTLPPVATLAPAATAAPAEATIAPSTVGVTLAPVATLSPLVTLAPFEPTLAPAVVTLAPVAVTPSPVVVTLTTVEPTPAPIKRTKAPAASPTVMPSTLSPTLAPIPLGFTRAPVPTPGPVATPAPSQFAPTLNGDIGMSVSALVRCEASCEDGIASAFDVESSQVVCTCPEFPDSRRLAVDDGGKPTVGVSSRRNWKVHGGEGRGYVRRRRMQSAIVNTVPYTVVIPGPNFALTFEKLRYFTSHYTDVATTMGVNNTDLEFSPVSFSATGASPITALSDGGDITLIAGLREGEVESTAYGMFFVFLLVLVCGSLCSLCLICQPRNVLAWRRGGGELHEPTELFTEAWVSGLAWLRMGPDQELHNISEVNYQYSKRVKPSYLKKVSPSPSQTEDFENFTNLVHATPPKNDPIYTEMIGTLGLFGTFYMSKADMDYCAMRLYSNFKQAQENMERHAILDSIDVMPEIYDILRHCYDDNLSADEKSLLATQLAPHWTNSEEARRALETAVVYTEVDEDAEFWEGLQYATDALSRYDQIIVTARIVLMFDGSSGQSQAIREAVPLFQEVYKIIRTKCPTWHEGNVQLMGVYLAITFLEYGLNSQTLGTDGQSTTLDWVHGLQPEDLEKFLAEKKEQRMRVLCLDLEPTGIPQQALQDDDEVIMAAHSIHSRPSPRSALSAATHDSPLDDDNISQSSLMSPQGLYSVHNQHF